MITAYLMVSAFIFGWFLASVYHKGNKYTAWEFIGIAGLTIAWPFLAVVFIIMHKDGKL